MLRTNDGKFVFGGDGSAMSDPKLFMHSYSKGQISKRICFFLASGQFQSGIVANGNIYFSYKGENCIYINDEQTLKYTAKIKTNHCPLKFELISMEYMLVAATEGTLYLIYLPDNTIACTLSICNSPITDLSKTCHHNEWAASTGHGLRFVTVSTKDNISIT